MSKPLIIWDWNGTLLDDAAICVAVMNGILRDRGMKEIEIDFYRQHFGFPVKDYYRLLGFDFSIEPFEQVGTEFIQRYEEKQYEAVLQASCREVLEEFSRMGYNQAILSAREINALENNLRFFNLNHFFHPVLGLNDHMAHGKEEVGKSFMDSLSMDNGQVLFIGDTIHDAQVADLMGVTCFLVGHGHQHPGRLEKMRKPVFYSLAEVKEAVLRHFSGYGSSFSVNKMSFI